MADMIKTTNELKFELAFADGDTRVFRLRNPRTGSLESAIGDINTLILQNQLLIGDKAGGAFTGIYRVTKINRNSFILDLS